MLLAALAWAWPAAASPPVARAGLLLDAEAPHALAWDAERHAGAVAVRDAVLVVEELRDGHGRAAAALGLVDTLALPQAGHLALGHDDGTVYAASARDGTLHGWRLQDGGERLALAAGGPKPDLLFHHPVLHKLLSFNAGAGTVTLFDIASSAFEGLMPLGDAPLAVHLGPQGSVLALLPERRELAAIGVRPLRVLARWPLPGDCRSPADFDVDPVGQRAFVACAGNAVAPFDLQSGNWTAALTASTSSEALLRVIWDGVRQRVISLTHDGTVAAAAGNAEGVRVLALLPPGGVVDFDAAGSRLVWASPRADGSGTQAGIAVLP